VHGHKNDAGFGTVPTHEAGSLETGHAGHSDIHQDYVGPKLANLLQGFGCIAGFADDREVGFAFKQAAHTIAEQGVIIDDDAAD
jgi:hypothetical protein